MRQRHKSRNPEQLTVWGKLRQTAAKITSYSPTAGQEQERRGNPRLLGPHGHTNAEAVVIGGLQERA